MMSRQDHQIIFLGEIRDDCLELVSRRWVNLVRQCFMDANPDVDLVIRHATATFQKDGDDAEDLLKYAENQLTLARQAESIKQGKDKDAPEDSSDC